MANPNKAFDPNMLVNAKHTTDWQFQGVAAQLAELKRLTYLHLQKEDSGGSTYWTITPKGENYLQELERAEKAVAASGVATVPQALDRRHRRPTRHKAPSRHRC